MPTRICIIRPELPNLEAHFRQGIIETGAKSLGLAFAYVSVYGAKVVRTLERDAEISEIKLITDVRDGVSHPQALKIALDRNWHVRTVNRSDGTFHAKVFVAGEKFAADGNLIGARMYLVGSSNLTNNGLNGNVECNVIQTSRDPIASASLTFKMLWSLGTDLDYARLEQYEECFANRNRSRSPDDLRALGLADKSDDDIDLTAGRQNLTLNPTISTRAAALAWTGLQSSTGEYRFQIEFPRTAGEVLRRIIDAGRATEQVAVLCEDDIIRIMTYRFYDDNSMFRLNVPNDVPGVEEARTGHSGIAMVETLQHPNAQVRLSIIHDTSNIENIVRRSIALGTLGRTRTRLYGWY